MKILLKYKKINNLKKMLKWFAINRFLHKKSIFVYFLILILTRANHFCLKTPTVACYYHPSPLLLTSCSKHRRKYIPAWYCKAGENIFQHDTVYTVHCAILLHILGVRNALMNVLWTKIYSTCHWPSLIN